MVGGAAELNAAWIVVLGAYALLALGLAIFLSRTGRRRGAVWFGGVAVVIGITLFVIARVAYEPPPPVFITISNTDDRQVVVVNGDERGAAGFAETRTFRLGRLTRSDRVEVRVTNDDGGYLWDIELRARGEVIFHDRSDGSIGKAGHNENDPHTGLGHRIVVDGRGRLLECYTHGSSEQECRAQAAQQSGPP